MLLKIVPDEREDKVEAKRKPLACLHLGHNEGLKWDLESHIHWKTGNKFTLWD